jgi:hypothetical protein
MYDLKAKQQEEANSTETVESNKPTLDDRSYYKNHFTNDLWSTKTSFIPTDSLF